MLIDDLHNCNPSFNRQFLAAASYESAESDPTKPGTGYSWLGLSRGFRPAPLRGIYALTGTREHEWNIRTGQT